MTIKNKCVFPLKWETHMDFVGCKTAIVMLESSHVVVSERFISLLFLPNASLVLCSAQRHFAKKNAAYKASNGWIELGVAKGNTAWSEWCRLLLKGRLWVCWTLLAGVWYGNEHSQLVHVACSHMCKVTEWHASKPQQAVGFRGVVCKIKLFLIFGISCLWKSSSAPRLFPDSSPHFVSQRAVG